jgi:hypothetical protein
LLELINSYLMNNVFSENVNKLILEFLYDILIYSKSKEDEEHYFLDLDEEHYCLGIEVED